MNNIQRITRLMERVQNEQVDYTDVEDAQDFAEFIVALANCTKYAMCALQIHETRKDIKRLLPKEEEHASNDAA